MDKQAMKITKESQLKGEAKTLIKEHHRYRGKQRLGKGRAVRRRLRKMGIRISTFGHHAGLHD